jgi:thiol-disulfide isomerase/thioredoxin/tetratricopeptide (TPR) repeat protein
MSKKYADAIEIQSWALINGARSDSGKKALEEAQQFVKEKGENKWTLLALAHAQIFQTPADSLATAEKLIKISPTDEESIFAYNSALFQNKKYQESLDWLAKNANQIKDKSRLTTAQAVSTYLLEKDKKDKGQVQLAFNIFDKSIKLNPNSVNTNYLYGNYLTRENKFDEAVPYLKKAAGLAPNVRSLQDAYWRAITSQTKKTNDQKDAELDAALALYLKQTKNSPDALLAVWTKYNDRTSWKDTAKPRDLQKTEQFEKLIIQKYPNTKYDEEIAFVKTRNVYGKYHGKNDSAKFLEINNKKKEKRTAEEIQFMERYEKKNKLYLAEKIELERAFIKRPQHFDKARLGQVSLSLLQSIGSKEDSSDDEVSDLIKLTTEHLKNYWGNLNADIALILSRRSAAQPNSLIAKDAEKYARLGIGDADKKIASLPKDAKPSEIQELQLTPLNVLAEALIENKKFDEAENLLLKVSQILEKADPQDFRIESAKYYLDSNWARFYVARQDWEKAENQYVRISSDNDYGRKTFEKFYEKRFSKKDGFDNYYAEIQKKLKIRAKERMAESRIKNPVDVVPFALKTIDEKSISFADLKGKIVVINVWGTWCAPCVAEMSELQEFFDKYQSDKDVAILTLDKGDTLETVKKFMVDRKLTLPVLMDDGYLDKIPQFGGAFPTTFFIDKNGKVAFVKVGNSGNLVEEFSWRVDLLKEN